MPHRSQGRWHGSIFSRCLGCFYIVNPLLGGSWVVISGVLSPLIWVISIVTLLIALHFLTTHEPQSSVADAGAAQLLPLLLAFGVLACLEHKSALNSRQTEGFLRGLIQDYSRGLGSRFRLLHGLRCRPWALRFRERLGHPALM